MNHDMHDDTADYAVQLHQRAQRLTEAELDARIAYDQQPMEQSHVAELPV